MLAQTVHTALKSVMVIPGVKGYVTVTKDEQHASPEASQLPATLIHSVIALARAMLHSNEDRRTDMLMDQRVAMRRVDTSVACVVADPATTENDLQRKLNALAIRMQAQSSQEPPSPAIPGLRELYVAAAGPLGALVFDRAIEQLKIARKARNLDALKELMESLAGPITPVWVKTELLERVTAILAEEAKHGERVPPPPRVPSLSSPPASMAPRAESRPPANALRPVVVVAQVARDILGPSSDRAVQAGVDLFSRLEGLSASPERLISLVAAELPELARTKFAVEVRARLASYALNGPGH
jgi:hypothetical protein